jgi:hypothetical protein
MSVKRGLTVILGDELSVSNPDKTSAADLPANAEKPGRSELAPLLNPFPEKSAKTFCISSVTAKANASFGTQESGFCRREEEQPAPAIMPQVTTNIENIGKIFLIRRHISIQVSGRHPAQRLQRVNKIRHISFYRHNFVDLMEFICYKSRTCLKENS